ncbi:MAG: hypothetical protein J0L70_30030 [Leptolyngbya sp. UWPOB_LEPTO1]|uniref:hypothetical protein n=1 Tax=Leptolyngbya sp. UWPOB_LEPTO1 TaxID=2815653 RepID=UPI001AD5B54F|nr:hypothetical protein [Leptolyngbya sp. UWPOB_LEPTO1]MBN8564774.1 hypothetical protein [Leptolyngbya sp. UWPOB_LEPTO1]
MLNFQEEVLEANTARADILRSTKVARATLDGGPLMSPFYDPDPTAVIHAAQDFTVSVTTVSKELYTKYREEYYGATIVLAQLTITLPTPNFPNKRTPSHLQTGSDRAA